MAKATDTAPTAAPSPGSADAGFGAFVSSSEAGALAGDLVVLGPPGEGKSLFAASGSAFWPPRAEVERRAKAVRSWVLRGAKGPPPSFDKVLLEDMAWLASDTAPLAGLNELGIVCPTVIDLQALFAAKGVLRTFTVMRDLLAATLPPKIRFLVHDTGSNTDKALVDAIQTKYDNDPKNTVKAWTDVLRTHVRLRTDLFSTARARGGNLITCLHARAVGDAEALPDQTPWKEQSVLMQEATGRAPITGDLTGKSQNLYKGHANFMFVIKREDPKVSRLPPEKEAEDPTLPKWWAYSRIPEWETKSRFGSLFADREVAHLGEMFDRIETILGRRS